MQHEAVNTMHHKKPVLHEGRGDSASEQKGRLAASLTVRMPDWMREMLDDLAEDSTYDDGSFSALSLDADDAGAVAREFIAAAMLKYDLNQYQDPPQITGVDDFPDGQPDLPGSLDATNDAQLTIRLPDWLKSHLSDYTGDNDIHVASGVAEVTRQFIALGYQLYAARSFPYGEPTPPSDSVLCPQCHQLDGRDAIWQRTFEYWPDLEDFWDELSYERENPFRTYIESNYSVHGWDIENLENSLPFGVTVREGARDHPDLDETVTVCHCHLCTYTDVKGEFNRAWFDEQR